MNGFKDKSKHSLGIPKKKQEVNYDKPLGKNIKFKNTRRQLVPVYACQSDTIHPKILELAKGAGLVSDERYKSLCNPSIGVRAELLPEELEGILLNYFGFDMGICEVHECHGIQKSRFGKQLAGELRYTGEERTDKEWLDSGLASREVLEFSKYGGEVSMEENNGYGNMVINDFLEGK